MALKGQLKVKFDTDIGLSQLRKSPSILLEFCHGYRRKSLESFQYMLFIVHNVTNVKHKYSHTNIPDQQEITLNVVLHVSNNLPRKL